MKEKPSTDEELFLCELFIKKLASSSPTPGGGGASALVGAVAAALAAMAANITLAAKEDADLNAMRNKAQELAERLTCLVAEDAKAFLPLLKANKLPGETKEQKAEKSRQLALAQEDACAVPLQIMKNCAETICLCEELLPKVKLGVKSDVGVGAVLAKAALKAASLNVFVNTKCMEDKCRAKELNQSADALLAGHESKAEGLFLEVKNLLIDKTN